MSATTITTGQRPASAAPPVGRRRAVAVGAAIGVALGGWVLAAPLAGVDLAVRMGPGAAAQQVGVVSVLVVSLLVALAGWALLAVLERRLRHGRRTWTVLASIVLVLSLAGPLSAATTVAATVALIGMHVVVAAVLMVLLLRAGGGPAQRAGGSPAS
jgi:hypothetical protein